MTASPSPIAPNASTGKKKGLGRLLKWLAIVVGALSFIFVIVVIVSPDTDPAPAEPEEAAAAAVEAEEAEEAEEEGVAEVAAEALPIADLDFGQVRDNWLFMSVEEWDDYATSLIGQRVAWSGWVMSIDAPGELWIDMDAPDDSEAVADVILAVPDEDTQQYSADQEISFEGTIAVFGDDINVLDVWLSDVIILP